MAESSGVHVPFNKSSGVPLLHLKHRLHADVILVAKPRDRPHLRNVDAPVRGDHRVVDVHGDDLADHHVMHAEAGLRPGSNTIWCSWHSKWTGEPLTRGGRTSREGSLETGRRHFITPRSMI